MINSFLIFISIFWSVVFVKKLLFWVYLWQLKEYHIGRFRDHLRTYKGKRLILSWAFLKILCAFGHISFSQIGLDGSENKFSLSGSFDFLY